MKILVIGLDGASPELLCGDERLSNIRRLMETGCFGPLESIVPPITVPAWMSMATSLDPGSLGVYGFRNRSDHSYDGLATVNSRSIRELAMWDQVAREGKRSVLVGVPPSFPPRRVHGVCVGCFLTPDPATDVYTHPPDLRERIAGLLGDYPVDVKGFRTSDKVWLEDEIYAMSRKHFALVRHLLQETEWDYFQFVEIGLDRMQHGFWKFHDPRHVLHEPGNPHQTAIRDYYAYLDEEVGRILELLDEETVVLVASDHGAQRLDGGVCVNEWLVRNGLLVLEEYPKAVTPFSRLAVDWRRTRVWSEGGYYARVFFNVEGREPTGAVDRAGYERFREEVREMLLAIPDEHGRPMATRVFRPEETYRTVRNVAPDLIVHFDGLYRRSIGGVGYPSIHTRENDTGPDDCNHAQAGAFVLSAPGSPLQGELTGARLLDIGPTLLELAGYDVPAAMQGRSLSPAGGPGHPGLAGVPPDREALVRERLRGLGYVA